jgi:phosphatidylglycerophosphatase A
MAKKSFREKIKPGIRPLPPDTSFGNIYVLIATWFGAGRLKPAPGTWGSIAAVPFGYALHHFLGIPGLALAAVLLMGIGTLAASWYGKKSGEPDDQGIVVDEVVGLWIAALPAEDNALLWLLALVLFRLFDIFKPWPASFFDKRKNGGFDVMMDDVVAGLYAMIGVASAAIPHLLQQ